MSHRILPTAAVALVLAIIGFASPGASAQPYDGHGIPGWQHRWGHGPVTCCWHHLGPWGWRDSWRHGD